ncbi:hypothetical protein ABT340_39600 [Streptosporangium sp. NPDC000239]|uniref:hypothetical protein n=1 Tax=Streptosporangium sp. NPDC000239 TaxID=3154248 RepID=UPI003328E7C5
MDEISAAPAITVTAKQANSIAGAMEKHRADVKKEEKAAKDAARQANIAAGRANPADVGRRASGQPPSVTGPDERGMSATIASKQMRTTGGGSLTLHRQEGSDYTHVTTADGQTYALTDDEVREVYFRVHDMDDGEFKVGENEGLVDKEGFLFGQIMKVGSDRYDVQIDGKRAFTLSPKDATRLEQAGSDLSTAKRLDTEFGKIDVFSTGGGKVGVRHLGDDGKPLETTFNAGSWRKLGQAVDVVFEGFDEEDTNPNAPDSGVASKTVKTNVGNVTVQLKGEWGAPDSSLSMMPEKGDWGVVVDGPHMDAWLSAIAGVLEESAGSRRLSAGQVSLSEATGVAPIQQTSDSRGRFRVLLIKEGWGTSGYYPEAVLRRDGPQVWPKGTHMYLNHPTVSEAAERPEGDVRSWASITTTDPVWDPAQRGLVAEVQVFPQWRQLLNEEFAREVGLSIRASGRVEYGEAAGREGPIVTSLDEGVSVDWVTKAGAGGRVLELIESARSEGSGLLRRATEAKQPPVKRGSAKEPEVDEELDGEDDEAQDGDWKGKPAFLKAKEAASLTEGASLGQWLEARMHLGFTKLADELYGDGRLTREERIGLSQAVGDGLKAFVTRVEADCPRLYQRAVWDSPEEPDDDSQELEEAPSSAAATTEPGSPPATTSKEEGMPELTEAQAHDLREANATAEAAKNEAEQRAAAAENRLQRFEALEAARPVVRTVLAESGLPGRAQDRLLATVTADSVPLADGRLDEEALRKTVTEAAEAEKAYLASLAEDAGAGQVRGLGESARTDRNNGGDLDQRLTEAFKGLGMDDKAAQTAAYGRG